ncbi:hypothetical protein LSH36_886g00038 [Paralvinella palmiformis]|uniref:C-type lectin domain-containing protein n=1 Tax=Paralvinella palmiformis TaxID=53620 RepID=A0AAD9IZ44_9ANNE|nr:hypothetical protein LSH36_886g00038 [Paralvinella palmiformis]
MENGIIVRDERIVIPSSLRKSTKEKVHTGHLGINACLRRAREILYWPVIIERHGLQPDNGTNLNDNSIATCSQFVTDGHQHTQIFQQTICTIDRMSVTLVGQDMKCVDNMYVAGLTGSDVGKAINKWKRCRPRRQTTTDDNLDWCIYECICTGYCSNQSICYMYGKGSWDDGIEFCKLIHPNARMIEEHSDEEHQGHISEAVRSGYLMYWIGARRPPQGDQYEFYWNSSGNSLVYTKWGGGQPFRGNSDADCITARSNTKWTWADIGCSSSVMYMCKIEFTE